MSMCDWLPAKQLFIELKKKKNMMDSLNEETFRVPGGPSISR